MESQRAIQESQAVRLGLRLRRARLARNLTQSEVAQQQFSVSYISAVERGQIRPSLGALERLAERLQVQLADLLSDEEVAPPPVLSGGRVDTSAERDEVGDRLREAQILIRQGRADDAVTRLKPLQTRSLTLREQALVHWHLAACHMSLGQPSAARRELTEAMGYAEKLGDLELHERLRNDLGQLFAQTERHQLAIEQYLECVDALEHGASDDPGLRLNVLCNLGAEYLAIGQADTAIDVLNRAATLAGEALDPARLAAQYFELSQRYQAQGNVARAREYSLRALGLYETLSLSQTGTRAYARLGRALAQQQRTDEALTYLGQALGMAREQQDPRSVAEVQSALSRVFLRLGRVDEAQQAATEANAMAEASGDRSQQAEALVVQAHIAAQTGEGELARSFFDSAATLLDEAGAEQALADVYAQYSSFLEQRGESARALDLLKQAWALREHASPVGPSASM